MNSEKYIIFGLYRNVYIGFLFIYIKYLNIILGVYFYYFKFIIN